MPEGGSGNGGDETGDWSALLTKLAERLGIGLLSLGGALGFVAAVGGALVWARFDAAQLPADQALDAMPQGELVATGAVALALFGALGVVATLLVYLFDNSGRSAKSDENGDRQTEDLSRGLLIVVAGELLVLTWLAARDADLPEALLALGLVATPLLLSLSLVRAGPPWTHGGDDGSEVDGSPWKRLKGLAQSVQEGIGETRGRRLLALVGFAVLVPAVVLATTGDRRAAALAGLGLVCAACLVFLVGSWVLHDGDDDGRRILGLRALGNVALILLATVVVFGPAAALEQWALGVAAGLAVAFGAAAWVAVDIIGRRRVWYAAIFVSVPVLGAVAAIVNNLADPQVQPLALLHAADGRPPAAIQGIYVTETEDRVYLASVATHQCTGELVNGSGQMLSIPREEVAAMFVGPRQSAGDAGKKAYEMAQALSRAGGVVAGAPAPEVIGSPGAAQADAAGVAAAGDGAGAVEGLAAAAGPALRRQFTEDQSLVADKTDPGGVVSADAGAVVTLKGADFGREPEGRTVRIGGEIAPLIHPKRGWSDERIRFTVPHDAASGPVTLECKPLGDQLALEVRHEPRAAFTLRPGPDGRLVALDGGAAHDRGGGEIVARRWRVGGLGQRGGERLNVPVLPDADGARVVYSVVDDDSDRDTAELKMWRLRVRGAVLDPGDPAQGEALDAIRKALDGRRGRRLATFAHASAPAELGLDLDQLSGQLSDQLDATLLGAEPPVGLVREPPAAFGDRCPIRRRAGSATPIVQIDVFVLGPGARVAHPRGC